MTRRPGFTLIELVSSLAVSSVVIVAMASSITLASRALPDASRPAETGVTLQRTLDLIASDARFATSLAVASEGEVTMDVPDRDRDDAPETITYRWAGTAGDPLTRQHNALDPATLLTAVDQVSFGWSEQLGTAEPSCRVLSATLRIGATSVTIDQRCLNVEAE